MAFSPTELLTEPLLEQITTKEGDQKWRAVFFYYDEQGGKHRKCRVLKTMGRDEAGSTAIKSAARDEANGMLTEYNGEITRNEVERAILAAVKSAGEGEGLGAIRTAALEGLRFEVDSRLFNSTFDKLFENHQKEEQAAKRAEEEATENPGAYITVEACISSYIDSLRNLERSTETSYRGMLKRGIAPRIGSLLLGDLKKAHCQGMVDDMVETYSRPYIANSLRLLKAALNWACDKEEHDGLRWIDYNPANRVKLKKDSKIDCKRPNALTDSERALLLNVVDSALCAPEAYGELVFMLAIKIALYSGLRRGEICALRWRDVDFEGVLHVEQSIGHTNGEFYIKAPKSKSSQRAVPVDAELVKDLKRRKAAMTEQCMQLGVKLTGDHYVLGGADGSFLKPPRLDDHWRALCKNLRLMGTQNSPVRFHGLRHTYATVLIDSGVPVSQVAAMMGHSNPSITLSRYASPSDSGMRKAAETIGGALNADSKRYGKRGEVLSFGKTGTED